jgi:hypothetical protein
LPSKPWRARAQIPCAACFKTFVPAYADDDEDTCKPHTFPDPRAKVKLNERESWVRGAVTRPASAAPSARPPASTKSALLRAAGHSHHGAYCSEAPKPAMCGCARCAALSATWPTRMMARPWTQRRCSLATTTPLGSYTWCARRGARRSATRPHPAAGWTAARPARSGDTWSAATCTRTRTTPTWPCTAACGACRTMPPRTTAARRGAQCRKARGVRCGAGAARCGAGAARCGRLRDAAHRRPRPAQTPSAAQMITTSTRWGASAKLRTGPTTSATATRTTGASTATCQPERARRSGQLSARVTKRAPTGALDKSGTPHPTRCMAEHRMRGAPLVPPPRTMLRTPLCAAASAPTSAVPPAASESVSVRAAAS